MNDFQVKLKKIPTDAQNFLTSMKSAELNAFICDKYGIKDEKIKGLVDILNRLYFKELKLLGLVPEITKVFSFDNKKAEALALDMAGIRLLPVKDWLGENLEDYIKKLGGKTESFVHYVEEQKDAIKEEEEYFKKESAAEEPFVVKEKTDVIPPRKINLKQEKNDSIEVFAHSLYHLLLTEENPYLDEYNKILIELLNDDTQFKNELEKSLYKNQELLTNKAFVLEGKTSLPSIANWIKDFIKTEGSDFFDDLVLSKYLTDSANAKKLDESEKDLLGRLLILFRNLKFFPDSMPSDDVEGWEIIPTIVEEEQKKAVKVELTGSHLNPTEKELVEMSEKFPAGSLERKAVEEEIKKLMKK